MQPAELEGSVKVFISYARADQRLRRKLEGHLSSLKHSGKITIWQDQEISPGANWEDQISTHLNEADLILLLISANFIASKYCWSKEVEIALQQHKNGSARIIPIILKPVYWQDTPLGQLQALPTGIKPITQWSDQDEAFEDVARGIQKVVEDLLVESQEKREIREWTNLDAKQEVFIQKIIDEAFVAGLKVAGYKKPHTTITNVKISKDKIQYDEA